MRILIVSDIHANLVAFETVLKDAGKVDRVWCLGDVVGYGPEPNACVERMRGLDALCLAGNHDWAVLDKLDLDDFNPDARRAAHWTRDELSPSNFNWLLSLPERVPTQLGKITLVHASPQQPVWEYVLTPAIARANFDYFDTPVCLMGHTHIPVIYRYHEDGTGVTWEQLPENSPFTFGPERMMINPGSVGQPRDGDPRSAYAILDSDTLTLTHRRVAYDIAATQKRMHQVNLPERLIARLSLGW